MSSATGIKNWTIYKITNPIGQIYIGCTSNFHKRMYSYRLKRDAVKKQRLLYAYLQKYDFINHAVEIIEEFDDSGIFAEGKEMFWIRTCMSNNGKWPEMNGLNLSDGGKGNIGVVHNAEVKLKYANARKGKKLTQEHIEKIRKANIGNKHTLGIKSTQEAINARRIARNKQAKSIIQCDLNGNYINEFKSVNEAASILGIDKSNIYGLLCGQLKKLRGFTFKYKN